MKKHKITVCLLVLASLLSFFIGYASPIIRAQQSHQVGLVVRFGDGTLETRCISFTEDQISGYEVLQRSGLNVVASFDSGMGAGVCKIENEGCPQESCLTCRAPKYWSYWHLSGGAWTYGNVGASSYTVGDGDVEGWSWGTGDPPDLVPFDQICAPPPTDTPLPTDTPIPPTDTPIPPTDTPVPSTNTPVPSTDTPLPPTNTPAPESPEAWFRLDQNPISAGGCTMLRWDTAYAVEVFLEDEPVDANGSRQVCPAAPQVYRLHVVGEEQEDTYELTLGVSGSSNDTATAGPTAVPSFTPSPTSPPSVNSPSPTDATLTAAVTSTPSGEHPSTSAEAEEVATNTPRPTVAEHDTATDSTATPVSVADLFPTFTPTAKPASVTEAPSAAPISDASAPSMAEDDVASPFTLIGYVAFSLIAGGLLGWLALTMFGRK